jgi:uncharacterized protein with FMN-binding domain
MSRIPMRSRQFTGTPSIRLPRIAGQRLLRGCFAAFATASTALAGCGNSGIHRSNTPVPISTSGNSNGTPGTSNTTGSASRTASGSFTGADVPTRYGDVQVSITVVHGRITDVGWLKLPFDRPRSQSISQQASPILRSEVLAAQSAQIDLLSGATYTSDAWATSVQAALSQVH